MGFLLFHASAKVEKARGDFPAVVGFGLKPYSQLDTSLSRAIPID